MKALFLRRKYRKPGSGKFVAKLSRSWDIRSAKKKGEYKNIVRSEINRTSKVTRTVSVSRSAQFFQYRMNILEIRPNHN